MGIKTVSVVISETMNVLWLTLTSVHMPVPSVSDFLKISQNFQNKWNFPHCIGAIDRHHVAVKKPYNSGKLYYNFKGYYSIVLQAVVDANYRYIFIDVGGFGSQHDSANFKDL
uniref:Harbi1_1 protein n=1 Tax=Fopius arisanus TaxID=64838 RepID=A0A0C9RUP9_9HYME